MCRWRCQIRPDSKKVVLYPCYQFREVGIVNQRLRITDIGVQFINGADRLKLRGTFPNLVPPYSAVSPESPNLV